MTDDLMTETDVAKHFKVTTRTVQKWRRAADQGPAFIEIGESPVLKTIRYRRADVLAYEESRKRGGAPIEPAGWRMSMTRAAACLEVVAGWQHVKPAARETVSGISTELRALLGAGK